MSDLPMSPATVDSFLADSPSSNSCIAPTVPLTPAAMDVIPEEDDVMITYESANIRPYSPHQVKREPVEHDTHAVSAMHVVPTLPAVSEAPAVVPTAPDAHMAPAIPAARAVSSLSATDALSAIPSMSPLARSIAQVECSMNTQPVTSSSSVFIVTTTASAQTRPAIQVISDAATGAATSGVNTTTSSSAPRLAIPLLTIDCDHQSPTTRRPTTSQPPRATTTQSTTTTTAARPANVSAIAPSRVAARRRDARAQAQPRPYQIDNHRHTNRHNAYANTAIRNDDAEIVRLGHLFQRDARTARIVIPELAVRDFLIYWSEQTELYYG